MGRIQALAAGNEQPMTPMQQQLGAISTQLAWLSAGVCGLVFVAGVLRGQPRLHMLNASISLAVAAVPEGLPAVSNSLLASGIRSMRRRGILARRLDAIENLGAVDVLCVDKTGTLTENRLRVVAVDTPDGAIDLSSGGCSPAAYERFTDRRLWTVLALCNESEYVDGELCGSSTEIALLQAAETPLGSIDALRGAMPRHKVRYRSEARPYMVTVHRYGDRKGYFRAVKGRPKQVLERCSFARRKGRRVRLTREMRDRILARNDEMMADALRVLGVACRHQREGRIGATEELEWLGLVGMSDPLRPKVAELLPALRRAGIRTIMLTGDQRGTAAAIGRQLGLGDDGRVRVLGADELEHLGEDELAEQAEDTQVFARVSPAMKLKLVKALQSRGHHVAMTGDGINDGPALKVANVGIAMGASGTDVARGMSDVVLKEDRLESIIEAIASGRSNYANLQKAIEYLLSTNFAEIELMFLTIAAGLPSPLTPLQLLWINLITDVFPALAIGMEPPEWDVLARPPEDLREGLINRRRLATLFGQSAVITGGTLVSFLYATLRYGVGPRAGTHAFQTLTFAQLLQALSSRSRSSTLYSGRQGGNPWLTAALGGSLALQGATLLPGFRRVLGGTRLGLVDLAVIGACATAPLLLNEAIKGRLAKQAQEHSGNDG
jgi:Ca2+-transporting ATPase